MAATHGKQSIRSAFVALKMLKSNWLVAKSMDRAIMTSLRKRFMPDMSIRGFSEDDYAALKAQASAAGKGLETWARETLLNTLKTPVVKKRYAYRVYTASGGHG